MMPHMSRSAWLQLKQQQKAESYLFDKLVLGIALVGPLITTTQIYQIWKVKAAAGNSLLTWGFYTFSSIVWLVYGIRQKNKPLCVSSFLWLVTEGAIVAEILHYS